MSSLIQKIQADRLQARKDKLEVKSSLLTTLYSEASKKGKDAGNRESTDEEVLSTIKSFLKNITTSKVVVTGHELAKLQEEENILTGYLPEMISTERLEFIVEDIIASGANNVGAIMKALKEKFPGQYDAALASRIIKAKVG